MERQSNWFVRTLVSLLCLLLTVMVVYRYFWIEPRADITWGLIVLIGFLLILAMGEIFDSFSLGKIINLSRQVHEKQEHVASLKTENAELRSQMITLYSSVSQRQSSTNIVGFPDRLVELLTVKKAGEEEIAEKKQEDSQAVISAQVVSRRRLNTKFIEETMLTRYVAEKSLHQFQLIREAKLVPNFTGIDPISDINPIFDGYLKTLEQEVFLEVRSNAASGIAFRERLYMMLSKIHHYRTIKQTNAYLALIIARLPEEESRSGFTIDRALRGFDPAVTSGLLRIESYELTEEQLNGIYLNDDEA